MDRDDPNAWKGTLDNVRLLKGNLFEYGPSMKSIRLTLILFLLRSAWIHWIFQAVPSSPRRSLRSWRIRSGNARMEGLFILLIYVRKATCWRTKGFLYPCMDLITGPIKIWHWKSRKRCWRNWGFLLRTWRWIVHSSPTILLRRIWSVRISWRGRIGSLPRWIVRSGMGIWRGWRCTAGIRGLCKEKSMWRTNSEKGINWLFMFSIQIV